MVQRLMAHSGLTTKVNGIALGDLTKKTLNDLGKSINTTWTGVEHVGGGILDNSIFESGEASSWVKSLPVTTNFNTAEFFDAISDPFSKNGTNAILAEVTGINVWNTVENADPKKVDSNMARQRINEMLISIERQIIQEIKDCLDKYLTEIINKNPELEYLLDIENAIRKATSKIRNKIKLKVEREIEQIAYDMIKIQQVAQLRQKITNAIRKICPSHHSPPPVTRISPSLTKQLDVDRSWSIVSNSDSILNDLKSANPDVAYHAQQKNSTAAKLMELTKEASTDIMSLGISQVVDNNDKNVFSYCNVDGSIV